MIETRRRIGRCVVSAVLLCACSAAGCTGGGESVVSGIGNSGNRIQLDDKLWAKLAEEFSSSEATPRVTDEEVREIFATIRGRALQGDFEAALIVLRIAEAQRQQAGS